MTRTMWLCVHDSATHSGKGQYGFLYGGPQTLTLVSPISLNQTIYTKFCTIDYVDEISVPPKNFGFTGVIAKTFAVL